MTFTFDGLVMLCSCDKIVPGMPMAAARLDLPTIFVLGEPMAAVREGDVIEIDIPGRRHRLSGFVQSHRWPGQPGRGARVSLTGRMLFPRRKAEVL